MEERIYALLSDTTTMLFVIVITVMCGVISLTFKMLDYLDERKYNEQSKNKDRKE